MTGREIYTPLIFSIIASFTLAVAVSSTVFVSPLISALVLFVGLSIVLAEKIYNKTVSPEALLVAVVLVSFSLGALRYSVKDFHEVVEPSVTGVVVSEPEDRENTRRFVLHADNGERVLVNAPLYNPVQYGDRVNVLGGKLERPGIIEDEGSGRDFDYSKYLSKDDIYWTLGFAEVEVVSSGHASGLRSILFSIKRSFVAKIREILPEPQSSLLAGLIIAGRDAMPKDILEEFRRAGVIHIVVLSGFNVALIAEFMRRLFQRLLLYGRPTASPRIAALAALIGIVLFVLMTGGEATVVRAAIMASTVVAAKLFGRHYSAPRALLVAGFVMVVVNPKILIFDPSFQLSFLATLGLIYLLNPFDKLLSHGFLTRWGRVRETLSQTIATQLAVLPLIIYLMGDVSLVSIPANLLVLVTIPYVMLLGFLATLGSYISVVIIWPLSFVSHILLSWILWVSHYLGSLPFASISVPPVPLWLVITTYILAAAFLKFSSTLFQFRFSKKSST